MSLTKVHADLIKVDLDSGDYVNKAGDTMTGDLSIDGGDLYLSGGVYFGGTNDVNKLDYYEEGNWTPTNDGCTFGITNAVYTRIGRLVNCSAMVETTSTGSSQKWGGLPFASAWSSPSTFGGFVFYQNVAPTEAWTVLLDGDTGFTFRQGIGAPNNFASPKNLRFNIIYNTDA